MPRRRSLVPTFYGMYCPDHKYYVKYTETTCRYCDQADAAEALTPTLPAIEPIRLVFCEKCGVTYTNRCPTHPARP